MKLLQTFFQFVLITLHIIVLFYLFAVICFNIYKQKNTKEAEEYLRYFMGAIAVSVYGIIVAYIF